MLIFLLTQWGYTAIHIAAEWNHKTVLDRLLPHLTSTVDVEDNCGETPLWLAADSGSVDCVQCLLAHGANPNYKR